MNLKSYLNETDFSVSLTYTLGRKLKQSGWSYGSRGSGIVAMNDDTTVLKQSIKTIEAWLESINAPETKMSPSKITKDMSVKYKDGFISIVETTRGLKVLFS